MQILDVQAAGVDFVFRWPSGTDEKYPQWIEYRAVSSEGKHHIIRIGFGMRATYGRDRKRVVVWFDGIPQAEFLGADDFEHSGEVLSAIKIPGTATGERICRYLEEPIPERYTGLPVVGLKTRVSGQGVQNAWAVVANVADHRVLFGLAALRRLERSR
ncbi:MAG: hypothetical protein WC291_12810 [Thermodesulfovibrionales bacterium]